MSAPSTTNHTTMKYDNGFRFKRINTSIEGIVIDLEGVWFDHGLKTFAGAVKAAFQHKGVEVTDDEFRNTKGDLHATDATSKVAVLRELVFKHEGRIKENGAANGSHVTAAAWVVPQMIPLMDKEYLARVKQCVPVQYSVEVLKGLREGGYKIAVIADCNQDALEGYKIRADFFSEGFRPDAFFSSTEVSPKAPQPWTVFHAMQKIGVYPANRVVRVTATVNGVAEGLNAGCFVVGVSRTGRQVAEYGVSDVHAPVSKDVQLRIKQQTEALYAAGAHFVIEGIWELPSVLEEIKSCQRFAHISM
eukprot:GDKI01039707.1.p1 GENE.GDKI01039707.1~~GDKI01039707.1.p1  ORF type:complete len:304 (+),score=110.16 GDKI01039707.1:84-995(+)